MVGLVDFDVCIFVGVVVEFVCDGMLWCFVEFYVDIDGVGGLVFDWFYFDCGY